jgi:hypothetical protein
MVCRACTASGPRFRAEPAAPAVGGGCRHPITGGRDQQHAGIIGEADRLDDQPDLHDAIDAKQRAVHLPHPPGSRRGHQVGLDRRA